VAFAGGSSNGSRPAGVNDFDNPGAGPVQIPWGTLSNTVLPIVPIALLTDDIAEPAETILVTGSSPDGTASVTPGVITIEANGTQEPGSITLSTSTTMRLGAGTVNLTGTASDEGAQVTLWGRTVDSTTADYTEINSVTAGTGGSFLFKPVVNMDGMYFKVSDGDLTSDPVRVNVKENPSLTASSPKTATAQVLVKGNPKVRGLAVKVFRMDGTKWVTAGTGILNASGTYTRAFTAKSGKTYSYRAQVMGNSARGIVTSAVTATKTVKVK
jgi:hypothetical protein